MNKCKCGSELLVPKYVKKSQMEKFKRGEPVDFCTRNTPKAVRLIVCDDCKAVVTIPAQWFDN